MKTTWMVFAAAAAAALGTTSARAERATKPYLVEVERIVVVSQVAIVVAFWTDATDRDPRRRLCAAQTTGGGPGVFRAIVRVPDDCAALVAAAPDVWIEETVDGRVRARRRISAVPSALGAARADSLADGAVPAGAMTAYAGPGLPAGWLRCDGQSYPCASHPRLCEAIGRTWGGVVDAGGRTIVFRVPDLRGTFVRGVDHGAGRDPDALARTAQYPGQAQGDAVGSVQGHELARHGHWPDAAHRFYLAPSGGGDNTVRDGDFSAGEPDLWASGIAAAQERGGNETRPINAYVEWLIKD